MSHHKTSHASAKHGKYSQCMFLQLTFFVHPILTPRKLFQAPLWSVHKAASVTEVPGELGMSNCNYRPLNMAMGNSNGTDDGHLKNVNMIFNSTKCMNNVLCVTLVISPNVAEFCREEVTRRRPLLNFLVDPRR